LKNYYQVAEDFLKYQRNPAGLLAYNYLQLYYYQHIREWESGSRINPICQNGICARKALPGGVIPVHKTAPVILCDG